MLALVVGPNKSRTDNGEDATSSESILSSKSPSNQRTVVTRSMKIDPATIQSPKASSTGRKRKLREAPLNRSVPEIITDSPSNDENSQDVVLICENSNSTNKKIRLNESQNQEQIENEG